MKIYRNADGMIIATERTINEPAQQSKLVNAVIKLFFIVSAIGFIYYVKLLRG